MLFDRYSKGNLRLPNRLVRSATGEGLADRDGAPSPDMVNLLVRLAKNGVGLVITGMTSPVPDGCAVRRECRLDSESVIPAFRRLTGAVHAQGGRIMVQLGHAGSRSIAPGVPKLPADWSPAELDDLAEAFALAAERAQKAGFDGIQLHVAHGYCLGGFLSPFMNQRHDVYGGTLANRMRFPAKVLQTVRRAVGDRFPVLVKINSEDFAENGLTAEESAEILMRFASVGLDAAEISGGVPESGAALSPVRAGISGAPYYREYAAKLRTKLPVPVILTGGIRDGVTAEKLLQERVCDLAGLCRPLVAEPDLAARWRARADTVSRCTGCNRCFLPLAAGRGLACMLKKERT